MHVVQSLSKYIAGTVLKLVCALYFATAIAMRNINIEMENIYYVLVNKKNKVCVYIVVFYVVFIHFLNYNDNKHFIYMYVSLTETLLYY